MAGVCYASGDAIRRTRSADVEPIRLLPKAFRSLAGPLPRPCRSEACNFPNSRARSEESRGIAQPNASTSCLLHRSRIASVGAAGNSKHRRTLRAVLSAPTLASILFSDIKALVVALGGEVTERAGSRVKITLAGEQWHCHRPHPGKEARRYQVDEARELLRRVGIER